MASAREKSVKWRRLPLAVCLVCLSLCLFACQSTGVVGEEETHPLSLLTGGSLLYLCADASFHQELVAALVASRTGLSLEDSQRLAGRLGIICVAAGGGTPFELACTARIPKRMAQSRLSKASSGFTKDVVRFEGFRGKKFTHTATGVEVVFLGEGLLCAGDDVSAMLENFAKGRAFEQSPRNQWLLGVQGDPAIRFYTERPLEFLAVVVGFPEGVGEKLIESIAGSFVPSGEGYSLEMYFRVVAPRAVSALKAMLTLSLSAMGASVEQAGDAVLKVSGIDLTAEDVTNLLSLSGAIGK